MPTLQAILGQLALALAGVIVILGLVAFLVAEARWIVAKLREMSELR